MTGEQWKIRVEELEAALRKARGATEGADRAKNAFLANMSHEICTPMNAILGFSAMLGSSELTAQQREWVSYIDSNGRALLDLINDILDLARIEAGGLQLSSTVFNLPALVDNVVATLRPRAQAQGLQLSAASAPEVQGDWTGDARRLRQVLLNLAGNAVKFTERGSVALEVSRPEDAGGRVLFTVRDTGIGMAPEVQHRLFTRFTQADESFTRRHGGTGLGLTISQALIGQMGGEIHVESQAGAGTTVRFSVVLERGHHAGLGAAAPAASEPAAGLRRPRHKFGRLRVLVAEGNAAQRKLIESQLRQLGLATEVAADGRAALDRMRNRVYDVVFLDVGMPEMNGLETTRWLRASTDYATRPDVPVIALTEQAMAGDRERCLAAGMNDSLGKPTNVDSLEEALGRVRSGGRE